MFEDLFKFPEKDDSENQELLDSLFEPGQETSGDIAEACKDCDCGNSVECEQRFLLGACDAHWLVNFQQQLKQITQ
ncbi:MAG: hypothetical protein FWD33_01750 [Alphaproteobacteria bacterium]|nr:hypothetical protein [Alphaproteobacteria bacterium]